MEPWPFPTYDDNGNLVMPGPISKPQKETAKEKFDALEEETGGAPPF